MTKYTEEEQLRAWNAWKDVCWVHGVGKVHGDLPPIGTDKDEACLVSLISKAFMEKLDPYKHLLENADNRKSRLDALDCAQEFDDALVAYKLSETPGHERYKKHHYGDPRYVRKAKVWKDFVWAAVAASEDPPTRVINGKLIGPKGVINQVVEEWLLSNFSSHLEDDMFVLDKSRDAETHEKTDDLGLDGFEQIAMGAISPDKAVENGTDPEQQNVAGDSIEVDVPEKWILELEQAFSLRLCCLVFAYINNLKIYNDREILDALGVSKTTAAGDLKKLLDGYQEFLSRLNPELRDWLICDDRGTRFFKNWIEKRCAQEKAGKLILSRIAER